MGFIINLILTTAAIIFCAYILPGVHVEDPLSALYVAISLAFLNIFLKPILIILTIPITIVTLGIFLIVINAIIISIADYMIGGFKIESFFYALVFSIFLSLVTTLLSILKRD